MLNHTKVSTYSQHATNHGLTFARMHICLRKPPRHSLCALPPPLPLGTFFEHFLALNYYLCHPRQQVYSVSWATSSRHTFLLSPISRTYILDLDTSFLRTFCSSNFNEMRKPGTLFGQKLRVRKRPCLSSLAGLPVRFPKQRLSFLKLLLRGSVPVDATPLKTP